MQLKKFHIGLHELVMLVLVIGATLLRFILIRFNWPFTNSDEGTMDLMALHIAYRGEHPIFYYGQEYMGPLEAYIGAVLFHIFGVSVFTLRLGLLPFFAFFLICMYYLTSMLYTKNLALATVGLLSLGSSDVIRRQLLAIGGYPEIVLFGALIYLLATWLALSSPGKEQHRGIRYAFLGFVIGLALWIDQLILPIVAAAGLLLLLFCRRESLWRWVCLIAGVVVGAFPLIIYNVTAPIQRNSLAVLLDLNQAGADQVVAMHISFVQHMLDTFLISLPVATGANLCHRTSDVHLFESPTDTFPCIAIQATWATALIVLWGTGVVFACITLWHQRHRTAKEQTFEERQTVIRHCARLLLLLSAAVTFVLFARSPVATLHPLTSSRYLICLSLATPAVLWALWKGLPRLEMPQVRRVQSMFLCRVGILLLIGTTALVGTITTIGDIPHTQANYMQENALIQHLLHLGATHIYSDYWTCNRIIFASNERIICASLDEHLGTGFDRYPPYRTIVDADGYASYVFPLDSPQATVFAEIHQGDTQYRQYVFEDYVVYQPDPPKTNEYSISLPQVCLASYNLEGGKYVPLSVRNAAHQLAT